MDKTEIIATAWKESNSKHLQPLILSDQILSSEKGASNLPTLSFMSSPC